MRTFFWVLFTLLSSFAFSQSLVVEYAQEVNLENSEVKEKSMLPPPIISTLIIDVHESYHSYEESDKYIDSIDEIQTAINNNSGDENNPKTVALQFGLSPDLFTYKNFKENLYFENAMLIFTKVKIHDDLPNIDWTIIPNENKKIGDYLCKKATALYRDELHIAWFTDEIPFSNGPYEFGGLPGLILRVETFEIIISVTKMINKSSEFTFDFPEIPAKKSTMLSLTVFNEEEVKRIKKMREDAKAGRPFTIDMN